MMSMFNKVFGSGVAMALIMACASGAAVASDDAIRVEGVFLGTYQMASRSHVDGDKVHNEGNGQLYMLGELDAGPGIWKLEVRGSTTPRRNGVSSFYGSNGLVGESLDANGNGRMAVTQLLYEIPLGSGELRAGLLDPTALFDVNAVTDDEYTQFLGDAFIDNLSIGFPSYVLGIAYRGKLGDHLGYKLFVGGDSGLEEGDHTYADTFRLNGRRDGHGKGAFTTAELDWEGNGYVLKAGVWHDSGRVDRIDARGNTKAHGLFATAGMRLGAGRLQASVGIANGAAQDTADFISLAYQAPLRVLNHDSVLGVAVARQGNSSHLPFDSRPVYQAEAYWRIRVAGPLYITPDLQYVRHADFDPQRRDALIGGVRIGVMF